MISFFQNKSKILFNQAGMTIYVRLSGAFSYCFQKNKSKKLNKFSIDKFTRICGPGQTFNGFFSNYKLLYILNLPVFRIKIFT